MARAQRSGVVVTRTGLSARLRAWRKRTPLNPYWLDWVWLRRAAEALAPHATGVLLDVGVSERPYEALFEPYVERYVGLDHPGVLEEKQPELWSLAAFLRDCVDVFGDGNRLPFRAASFDTVLCMEVLEHLIEPDRCVAEMARVLRPGGRLLLTVPFSQQLHFLPADYSRFTPAGIRAICARHGLEVERLEPRGNYSVALGAMSAQYLLRSFGAKELLADGSVIPSRWRSALITPLVFALQGGFHLASKMTRDEGMALGYWAVARKRAAT